jgi:hypothetical protein
MTQKATVPKISPTAVPPSSRASHGSPSALASPCAMPTNICSMSHTTQKPMAAEANTQEGRINLPPRTAITSDTSMSTSGSITPSPPTASCISPVVFVVSDAT